MIWYFLLAGFDNRRGERTEVSVVVRPPCCQVWCVGPRPPWLSSHWAGCSASASPGTTSGCSTGPARPPDRPWSATSSVSPPTSSASTPASPAPSTSSWWCGSSPGPLWSSSLSPSSPGSSPSSCSAASPTVWVWSDCQWLTDWPGSTNGQPATSTQSLLSSPSFTSPWSSLSIFTREIRIQLTFIEAN